jgi:hypothetical protein
MAITVPAASAAMSVFAYRTEFRCVSIVLPINCQIFTCQLPDLESLFLMLY